ncbi:MAG: DGQHR domain-containing protein [Methylococcales bacterium]|nr:DGQHR domain-containing protein [Methylococcales bacterium]
MREKITKTTAIKCVQNGYTFYTTILNSELLKEKDTCYVSRRDEDSERGFQRSLNESRAKDIANYLDKELGCIPSSLILSIQDHAQFQYHQETSQIWFSNKPKIFMVIDGQHRLYGLIKSEKNYDVPVIIFNSLKTSDEVSLFIDINTKQKGVPTTLLLDIKNLAGREDKKEEKQKQLFDELNKDSVLAGLMSPTKSQVGKITRVSFNGATNQLFENSYFEDKDVHVIYKGIKNYLQAVENIFKKSKSQRAKLNNGTLFKAIFNIFNEVIDKTLKEYGNLRVESLEEILDPISRIEYDTYVGSNRATLQKLTREMRSELNQHKKMDIPVDDIF